MEKNRETRESEKDALVSFYFTERPTDFYERWEAGVGVGRWVTGRFYFKKKSQDTVKQENK